jgi:ABC-2 type transport system permease protein
MNKIALIIRREYVTRVRKKSFIIMTILGPLVMGGLIAGVVFLSSVDKEQRTIAVVDQTGLFGQLFKNDESTTFLYPTAPFDSLRRQSREKGYFGILLIPSSESKESLEKAVTLYSEKQASFALIEKIKFALEKKINDAKYQDAGIDPVALEKIKTNVRIQTRDLENNKTSTPLTTVVGFAGGLLIYLFTFLYGAQVMRGVMEEKMSRIVEVIISSVKPMQLMMGKIIGVALVGLTQFLLWVVLTGSIYGMVMSTALHGTEQQRMEELMKSQRGASVFEDNGAVGQTAAEEISDAVSQVNFPLMIGSFIFYFLGGYLLYAALFAAIGSAVDSETDTQQFMLPVTIPLVLAYVASANVIQNPDGAVGFWFSMIPLTSPVVMMVRLPFGVPWYQVAASMGLLVLGFLFTTWLAARIYRIGILMYGKKVSYGELAKWIRYKD